ncbi:2103_t:CDS:1, partial [Cetraspora pellucida]
MKLINLFIPLLPTGSIFNNNGQPKQVVEAQVIRCPCDGSRRNAVGQ